VEQRVRDRRTTFAPRSEEVLRNLCGVDGT